jgi:hypothetical protein
MDVPGNHLAEPHIISEEAPMRITLLGENFFVVLIVFMPPKSPNLVEFALWLKHMAMPLPLLNERNPCACCD